MWHRWHCPQSNTKWTLGSGWKKRRKRAWSVLSSAWSRLTCLDPCSAPLDFNSVWLCMRNSPYLCSRQSSAYFQRLYLRPGCFRGPPSNAWGFSRRPFLNSSGCHPLSLFIILSSLRRLQLLTDAVNQARLKVLVVKHRNAPHFLVSEFWELFRRNRPPHHSLTHCPQ